jgi:hypothetical protein
MFCQIKFFFFIQIPIQADFTLKAITFLAEYLGINTILTFMILQVDHPGPPRISNLLLFLPEINLVLFFQISR